MELEARSGANAAYFVSFFSSGFFLSSSLSRLSSTADQTPVPFTSSFCPTAYISESKAVLMVQ